LKAAYFRIPPKERTMKKFLPLILLLAALSLISGFLMSKASLIGRVGISLFYKQYKFLKIWWQGALVVFICLIAFLIVQGLIQRNFKRGKAAAFQVLFILLALAGLYFTYADFRHSLNHRWLGERFHLGAYLFWVSWIIISLFYMVTAGKPKQTFDQSITNI
jgi:hypothetical protein